MNDKWIKWILWILIFIFSAISTYAIVRVDNLSDKVIVKSEYYKDYSSFCDRFDRMENKIDKILENQRNARK